MKSSSNRKREVPPSEQRSNMPGTATVLEKPKETKKVIVEFSGDLLERTEAAASELSTNRSKLIRRAVEKFLNQIERRKLEHELAEAYAANAVLAAKISEEFSYVDGEDL